MQGCQRPPEARALPARPGAAPTAGHLQMKPRAVLEATAQVPPFLQGFPLQPLMTDSQRRPGDERGGEARPPRPRPAPHPPPGRAPTGVAGAALAVEVVDALHAVLGAAGVTGVGETLVDVALAALAHEAGQAGAGVAAHLVHAGAVVEALGAAGHGVDGGVAVVHVDLAVHACRGAGVRDPHGTRCPLPPWMSGEARTGTHRCPSVTGGWHSGLPGAGGLAWLPVGPAPAFRPHEALARSGMPLAGHRGPTAHFPWTSAPVWRPLPCVPRGQEHL